MRVKITACLRLLTRPPLSSTNQSKHHRPNTPTLQARSIFSLSHNRRNKPNEHGCNHGDTRVSKRMVSHVSDYPDVLFAGEYKPLFKVLNKNTELLVPRESDFTIIGGGVMGLSMAYWLKMRNPKALTVTVIEKDLQYTDCSTTRAIGGIRQQFSLPENIKMSMYGAEFLKDIRYHLNVIDMDPPDVHFNPQGYLFLSTEKGSETLLNNFNTQQECGASVELLHKDQLSDRHKWLNTEDITHGTYGYQNEGWFDPWLFLAALKAKCLSLGTEILKAELVDFCGEESRFRMDGKVINRTVLQHAMVKAEDDKIHGIRTGVFVNCGGCWAQEVGLMAGIGNGEGAMSVPIPVEKRKRLVFMFHCPDGPGIDMPLLVDPSGVYVRREGLGGNYICGVSPTCDADEPCPDTLEVTESDHNLFQQVVWPQLAHRIPAFENLKLKTAWAGYYDYNTFDQNLIVGNHPYHRNFMMACGSSGHGLQHAPAIGRGLTEYILDSEYKDIDLSALSFDRVLYEEYLHEVNIV